MIYPIFNALKAVLEQQPNVKRVEWYVRQEEFGEPIILDDRIVYVEFPPINWNTLQQKRQQTDLVFNLHCAFSDKRGRLARAEATAIRQMLTVHEVHTSLQGKGLAMDVDGVETPICAGIKRTGEQYNHSQSKISTHVLTYTTRLTDDTAVTIYEQVTLQPEITAEIDPA